MKKSSLVKAMACFMSATMAVTCVPFSNVTKGVSLTAKAEATVPEPVAKYDFESGVPDGCTIIGTGKIEDAEDASHGKIFHNAVGGQDKRTNYLTLPSDLLTKAVQEKGELTVSMDVNVGTAVDYFYTPLFSAYATQSDPNSFPMMIIQSRGLTQVNCNGWTDFTAEENVKGANEESTAYLDDKAWHNVTVTYTKEKAVFYVDGAVMNEWNIDSAINGGLDGFLTTEGASQLTYICLGGNQAWDWNDVDAAYLFDNVAIFSSALTAEQVAAVNTVFNGGSASSDDSNEAPGTTSDSAIDTTPAPDNDADQNQTPAQDDPDIADNDTLPDDAMPDAPDDSDADDDADDTDLTDPDAEDDNDTDADDEATAKKTAKLNKKKATIKVGKSVKLKVKNTSKKVTWSSSNKKVAKVNKSGKVTGVKTGKATIKAKVGKKTLKCKVTVKK